MKEENLYPTLENYILGRMTPEERLAFEAEFANEAALKRHLRSYQYTEKAAELAGQLHLSEALAQVRQQKAALPAPRLSWMDYLRFAWYEQQRRWLLASSMVALCALVAAGFFLWPAADCPLPALLNQHYLKPKTLHARAAVIVDRSTAEQASEWYAAGLQDSLDDLMQRLPDPAVPTYYAAHLAFEQQRYAEAERGFAASLAARISLKAYAEFQDMGRIKFNLLLSRLALQANREAALKSLAALRQDEDVRGETEVLERIAQLEQALIKSSSGSWKQCQPH